MKLGLKMRRGAGFTLIELVMVIMIAGILSAYAMTRVGLFSGWEEAGTSQVMSSYIGGAQRLAIANHRNVYMNLSASAISACYDAGCLAPSLSLDGSALKLVAPSGSFTFTSSSFYFDPQGRPSFAGAFTIGYGAITVHIEPETGLVW